MRYYQQKFSIFTGNTTNLLIQISELNGGREPLTPRDAADYIMKLPKVEQDLEEWQTATGCMIGAAEARDLMMHARIGLLRALNRNIQRMLTDRKEMPWGRRKLKRDQQ